MANCDDLVTSSIVVVTWLLFRLSKIYRLTVSVQTTCQGELLKSSMQCNETDHTNTYLEVVLQQLHPVNSLKYHTKYDG